MTYPTPSRSAVITALRAHGVHLVIEPIVADAEGRPWSSGLRAIVDHHTAGTNSLGYLKNAGGTYPYVNTLIDRDGTVHLLSTLSTWGSGKGGPWKGIAAKDSLHLVAWQNEVEDKGVGKTFTSLQLESLGRVNAALLSLGVPARNEVNHRDWTDGTATVGGYPLATNGRKADTRYEATFLQANTAKYRLGTTNPGDDMALTPAELDQIADRVWTKALTRPWDGKAASAGSILTQAHYYAIQGGFEGDTPATATSAPGARTVAKRILQAIAADPATPAPGGGLSDADVEKIAGRVADLLAARLKS